LIFPEIFSKIYNYIALDTILGKIKENRAKIANKKGTLKPGVPFSYGRK
jgi:hypothetical protein